MYLLIYIYIYIYIMLRCLHGCTWLSPDIRLDQPKLLAGPLDNILCPYRVVVDKFFLVNQHLHFCLKSFIGENHFWVRPYFPSSIYLVLIVFFLFFFMPFEMKGRWPYRCCFVECSFQDLIFDLNSCSLFIIFTNPTARAGYDTRSFLSGV